MESRMTTTERSRREIREIAAARLEAARKKVGDARCKAFAEVPPLEIPKKHLNEIAAIETARQKLFDRELVLIRVLKEAGFNHNGYRPATKNAFFESPTSPRRKALIEKFETQLVQLEEAAIVFYETLALAFSPTEFRTAFEDFLKVLNGIK
jgi:hypothetical protein